MLLIICNPYDQYFKCMGNDICSDLGNAKLSGSLVPELGKLERLQYL
jgi:hypothetical protein